MVRVYAGITRHRLDKPTQPLRILIAEDEAMIALFLADLLEGMGHEVVATVESAPKAVAAAATHHPDLIISDGNLREGSGVLAVEEILRARFVPHIFVTGDPYQLGAAPSAIIVQKPFTADSLIRAIDRAFASVDTV